MEKAKQTFKNLSLLLTVCQCCGCVSPIPDPDFYPSRIPDLGSKNIIRREG
jgi:hypothetical protein